MVCSSCLRSVIVRAGKIGILTKRRVQISNTWRSLHACVGVNYTWNCEFRRSLKMMVDSSGAAAKRGPIVDILPEKEDDGGYVSGGWKSEDGKLSCGYSSFRGKRATMEDFFNVKTSTIDGQAVCMFGIFDG
ncbi:hypothetical protein Patl1_20324 [Pistacia atlantica]|uniref:Uncharacterized protein n=1 Tax=Pistacia atlantica TaxID=434234 RepID=A0ACC1BHW4_9ROSI|nr:hypothetical protein Patl1_20324 [Pistacia atlantica]